MGCCSQSFLKKISVFQKDIIISQTVKREMKDAKKEMGLFDLRLSV